MFPVFLRLLQWPGAFKVGTECGDCDERAVVLVAE